MTEQSTVQNVTIFGVGAMGTLFGSRLHPLANVMLYGHWPEQLARLQHRGLSVITTAGKTTHHRLEVTDQIEALPLADIVLILVKSYQTKYTAQMAAKVLKPNGLAITLQNGLGNLDVLAEAVGPERAALGITAQGATVVRPGVLRHAGEGHTYLAGTPTQQARLKEVAALFSAAGLATSLVDDPDSLVWGKLAINAGINPLTALLNLPNGALAENSELHQIMSAAATEVANVATALNIPLPYQDAAQRTAEVSRATAANRSSMLQDVSRAAPTEIDVISGAVVRIGQQVGIPTPVNQQLLTMIKAREQGRVFSPNQLDINGITA